MPTGAFVVRRNGKVFVTGNSGFPKSMDVSKAIDKAAGAEREVIGHRRKLDSYGEQAGNTVYGSGPNHDGLQEITAPATDAAKQWSGWGTALKPAIEPIILARKPLDGTVAANVLEHGVGGLNIDASRVSAGSDYTEVDKDQSQMRPRGEDNGHALGTGTGRLGVKFEPAPAGRFPANVLLDEHAAKEMDRQSGVTGANPRIGARTPKESGVYGEYEGQATALKDHGDSGGASRFFPVFKYQAKAPKKERPVIVREDGTKVQHPTVKPEKLMEWLVVLTTPPGGTVLDPFAGTGTTLQAARNKGFRAIGIEQDADYIQLINARLETTEETLFTTTN